MGKLGRNCTCQGSRFKGGGGGKKEGEDDSFDGEEPGKLSSLPIDKKIDHYCR